MSKSQKNTKKTAAKKRIKWGSTASERNRKPKKSELQIRRELLNGYIEMVDGYRDKGYDIYLFTFLFNKLPGKEQGMILQMKGEIHRFYSRLATRIARKPKTRGGERLLPFMVLFPDKPVFKYLRQSSAGPDLSVNEGLHYHGVCAADRRGKITDFLDQYFSEHQATFTSRKLRTVDVRRVMDIPGYVTDYALKSIKRPWFDMDDVMVLPRSIDRV